MRRISVLYPPEVDLREWVRRHARREVPGCWPYGLEQLSVPESKITARNLPPRTLPRRVLSTLGLPRLRLLTAGTGSDDTAVTWDEHAAHLMATARPHRAMYSGVVWLPDSAATRPPDFYRRIRGSLNRMEKLWVCSAAQVEPLSQFLGPGSPAVEYVQFGVDHEFYRFQPYPEAPLVMSAGGDRHRDPQTLFSALAVVKEQMPEAEIVVQSRSPLPAPPGIAKIRALSHTGLRDLYARASVVVVATSSNLHVSGMTVGMEAMATGRPVAMTGTPGMEDYISDGVTGRLTPPGDPAALAASVLALLRDPVTARRMGLAARREIEGSMTTTHLAGRLSRFLRS